MTNINFSESRHTEITFPELNYGDFFLINREDDSFKINMKTGDRCYFSFHAGTIKDWQSMGPKVFHINEVNITVCK